MENVISTFRSTDVSNKNIHFKASRGVKPQFKIQNMFRKMKAITNKFQFKHLSDLHNASVTTTK